MAKGSLCRESTEQMAEGARIAAKADIGVSATGVAGPTGGTAEKPVGLVYIALSDKDGAEVRKLNLSGNRDEVRAQTCEEVFKLISERI